MSLNLSAQHLAKAYRGRQVIKDVSLNVAPGEVVGLLGPNGAGKTTCFYMIVGLIRADAGEIRLGETPITALPMHTRARLGLGYLPQEASVFRRMSVRDNLLSILQLRPDLDADQREQWLEQLLDDFHISHIRHSLGISLSGGERRRVEIARALAANPRFVLLDEPFAGVDPISVNDIKRIIEQLRQRGLGVLITDHNVRETLSACERAYIVSEGRIIAEGDAETILANPEVRKVYLGDDFRL